MNFLPAALSKRTRWIARDSEIGTIVAAAHSEQIDWRKPWRELLALLNVICAHAVGIVVIVLITEAMALFSAQIPSELITWQVANVTFRFADVLHYFDLGLLLAFLAKSAWDVLKWAVGK